METSGFLNLIDRPVYLYVREIKSMLSEAGAVFQQKFDE